jgi:c-di-GMP-binding flagellar brake protein YcgR
MHNSEGDTLQAVDRRRYNRHDFRQEISYSLHLSPSEKTYTGSTVNISCGGMCLCVSNPVGPGQKITIKRGNQFYVEGNVVWCNEISGRLHPYKVGLQFV